MTLPKPLIPLLLLLLLLPTLITAQPIVTGVATKKGVYLRWDLAKKYKGLPIKIYRKRPDRAKRRLLTKQPIRPATSASEVKEILGDHLENFIAGETLEEAKQDKHDREAEKDVAAGVFDRWAYLSKSEREKLLIKSIIQQHENIEFLSLYIPAFAKALGQDYFDTTAQPNVRYTYSIYAISGGREVLMVKQTVSMADQVRIQVPPRVRGEAGENRAKILWNPLPPSTGVIGYNVYRNEYEKGDYKKLNKTPIAFLQGPNQQKKAEPYVSYLDQKLKNGQAYYYQVSSVHFSGVESDRSKKVKIRPLKKDQPPAPFMVKVELSKEGYVRVVWQKSKAENVAYYEVFRSPGNRGAFKKINPVAIGKNITEYVDEIKADQIDSVYFYRVRAVNKKRIASGFSAAMPVHIERKSAPARLQMTKAEGGPESITVFWKKTKDKYATHYEIYRAPGRDKSLLRYREVPLDKTQFKDTNVDAGRAYYYAVAVRDRFSNLGPLSDRIKGKSDDSGRKPVAPAGVRAQAYENSVIITWKPVYAYNVKGFNLYRRPVATRKWRRINDKLLGLKEKRFVDSLPVTHDRQVYAMRAVSQTGVESDLSEVVYAAPWRETLAGPKNLKVLVVKTRKKNIDIGIYWDIDDISQITGFHVYRAELTKKQGPFQKINSSVLPEKTRSFVDSKARPEKRYMYYVEAIGRRGEKVAQSSTKSINLSLIE